MICREHRSTTFASKFGKGSKNLYVELADARTPAAFRALQRRLTPEMKAFLDKAPLEVQFKLFCTAQCYGKLTSNQVESENGALAEVRGCKDTAYGCVRFVEYSQEKFEAHKNAAGNQLTLATPRTIERLAVVEAEADHFRLQWIDEEEGHARIFPGDGHAHHVARISGDTISCTCCVPVKDQSICACLARLARSVRPPIPLQTLIFEHNSSVRWREQYATAGEFAVPNTADVGSISESDPSALHKALAIPRGRGRPKKTKRGLERRDYVKAYAKKLRAERAGDEDDGAVAASAASTAKATKPSKPSKGSKAAKVVKARKAAMGAKARKAATMPESQSDDESDDGKRDDESDDDDSDDDGAAAALAAKRAKATKPSKPSKGSKAAKVMKARKAATMPESESDDDFDDDGAAAARAAKLKKATTAVKGKKATSRATVAPGRAKAASDRAMDARR